MTAPFLSTAGHDVRGLDSFLYRGCDFTASKPFSPAHVMDIRDVRSGDLVGFDAIVHLAALSNDPTGDLDPDLTFAINQHATIALARAAKEAGVERFLFASSCSIYGAAGDDDVLDETAPLRPLTAYAESKARAEEQLHALADSSFSPIFMRNATAYGVSPRLRLDVVLNNLAAWAYTTGAIRLFSDGAAWRPLVHVQDIAQATLALLTAPRMDVHGEAFNIGSSDQNVQIHALADLLRQLLACRVEMRPEATTDPRSYRVSFAKLERVVPTFCCLWTVQKGAEELLAAFKREGLTLADLTGERFTRLHRLRALLGSGELRNDLTWANNAIAPPRKER